MQASSNVVSMKGRRDPCAECHFVSECIAREPDAAAARPGTEVAIAPRVVRRGDHLFRGGDRFDTVYMVRSGAVKSYTLSANGEEQVIGFHMPGDLVGVDGIDDDTHVSSAVALDTSSVCPLPFERLCALCTRSLAAQRRLLRKMSRRVRDGQVRLQMLGQRSADQRIASFLLQQSNHRAARGYSPDEINLAMPRADIASYLTLAVETVSRVLTRLQEAGVLAVQRNHVEIRDRDALVALAEDAVAVAAAHAS